MWKWLNPEIALGFLVATIFWAGVLGWQAAYAPTERVKNECYEAAQKSGHKTEECKSLWERTTSDPVALFTFVLSISTIGLWAVTWRSGVRQTRDMEGAIAAANKQVAAVITAERPYIVLKITEPGAEVSEKGNISFAGKRLKFKFVNHGRTPALIDEVKEVYRVVEGVVDVPSPLDPMKDRGRLVPIGTVSAGGAPFVGATNLFNNLEDDGAIKMLEAGAWKARRMCFYGFVRYRDSFGTHYINGFLAIYAPEGNVWVLRGDERYNYSRPERPENIPPHPDYT